MPLSLEFEFSYFDEPLVLISIGVPLADTRVRALGLIDTGAQISLFDQAVASRLGLELDTAQTVGILGVGGAMTQARRAEVNVWLLDEPRLSVTASIAFTPRQQLGLRNLIGLDILSSFDFGLSHAARLGYLGRAST